MENTTFQRWRKSRTKALEKVYEVLRALLILRPILWFLQLYDIHWAPLFRRNPERKNLKYLARGDRPYLLTPLPRKRKRALTNPLPSIKTSRDLSYSVGYLIRRARQRTEEQGSCLFLERLPFELREMVYMEVLVSGERKSAYIQRRRGWLAVWSCSKGCCKAQRLQCLKGWLEYKKMIWRWDKERMQGGANRWSMPGVLLTCRAVYSETIPLLYSRSIFRFYDPADLPLFCQTILPHRLNAIQSLKIDWSRYLYRPKGNPQNPHPKFAPEELKIWCKVWDIISRMQSLTEVRIELEFHHSYVPWGSLITFCRPMMGIKGLKRFELVVPWHDSTDWGFAEHAPFTIVKAADPRDILDDLMAMSQTFNTITYHQERSRLVH